MKDFKVNTERREEFEKKFKKCGRCDAMIDRRSKHELCMGCQVQTIPNGHKLYREAMWGSYSKPEEGAK